MQTERKSGMFGFFYGENYVFWREQLLEQTSKTQLMCFQVSDVIKHVNVVVVDPDAAGAGSVSRL